MTAGRYLASFFVTILTVVGTCWTLNYVGQRAYKDLEYAVWSAKMKMVASCDFANTVALGDSRATAALLPSVLFGNQEFTNLALVAAGPVEAYVQLEHIFACPNHPRRIILSFSPQMLSEFPWFWDHDFGFFQWADLHRMRMAEVKNGRYELHNNQPLASVTDAIRDWMFVHRFPSFDFANILNANWSRRWANNKAGQEETLIDRGYHVMGNGSCAPRAGWEAYRAHFEPSALASTFLEQIVDEASHAGIKVIWVSMPVSDLTDNVVQSAFRSEYQSYIRGVLEAKTKIEVVGDLWSVMERCAFGDPAHLHNAGAHLFSRMLAAKLNTANEVE